MSGCHSCPIRCMTQLNVPRVKDFGVPSTGGNTCVANFVHTTIFPNGPKDFDEKDDGRVVGNLVGLNLFDDYGIWCNYGQLHRDFTYCYAKGVLNACCRLKSMPRSVGISWKRAILILLKISTTARRIASANSATLQMGHMPLPNAGI